MGAMDQETRVERLLEELAELRKEIELLRKSESRNQGLREESYAVDAGSGRRDRVSTDLTWNQDYFNLPTLDDETAAAEPDEVLEFGAQSRDDAAAKKYLPKSVTESGSFDLRWMRFAAFGRLLDAVPIPMVIVDEDGVIHQANEAMRTSVHSDMEPVGASLLPFLGHGVKAFRPLLKEAFETRKPVVQETPFRMGRREAPARITLRSLRFGSDRCLLVALQDLSPSVRAVQADRKYRALLDRMPFATAEFTLPRPIRPDTPVEEAFPRIAEAKITHANTNFARLHGYSDAEDLKEVRSSDVFSLDEQAGDLYRAWILNAFDAMTVEVDEPIGAGERRSIQTTLFGAPEGGVLRRFWAMRRDVSKRRRIQQELVEKIRVIDELYERLGEKESATLQLERTATVIHEVRQPLAIIGGFARRVERRLATLPEDDPGCSRDIRLLIGEIQRLERILERLNRTSGRIGPDRRLVDPNSIIEYVIQIHQGLLSRKGIRCLAHLEEMPAPISLDTERFQQLVRNLVSNAIEATPQGRSMRVESRCLTIPGMSDADAEQTTEQRFELVVYNQGAPISSDHLERIFNPFFTTKASGTGIGLTLARTIAEEHGGSITARSGKGGTEFRVSLPVKRN